MLPTPKFNPPRYKEFEIPRPCYGGVNLADLPYEQDPEQSPNCLNMMYRNGAFSKRYGQSTMLNATDEILAVVEYDNKLFLHIGDEIKQLAGGGSLITEISGIGYEGIFIKFNKKLYYLADKLYEYHIDEKYHSSFIESPLYIPDILINRKPDGSYKGDDIENYNLLGSGFRETFNGDGESTDYILYTKDLDATTPKVMVDEVEVTDFTYDAKNGSIKFTSPPSKGTNNVEIVAYKTEQKYIDQILGAKYYVAYGGDNNSRLFLAGGGDSNVYYSGVGDGTYFPDNNNFTIGNDTDDVTGFGIQYDRLMVFKPNEIYSMEYYIQEGIGQFKSKLVNSSIGCDKPNTIQLINNSLVWLNSSVGVCILLSTNIEDERNVRVISRNVNGKEGLLYELDDCYSVDYDGKYFLSTGQGKCFVWDYTISPYYNTGKPDNDAKRLSWFVWDNFNVKDFISLDGGAYYRSGLAYINKISGTEIVKLNDSFNDFGNAIHSVYETPMLQFDAVAFLKTIKEVFIQVRDDTSPKIDITYISDGVEEHESEPISIPSYIWSSFLWQNFTWSKVGTNVFRRKCSLKKIQMASVRFENNDVNRDMSITHLTFRYTITNIVK